MSNIKYTYIPLDKATIVDRRHQREVQPPGMVNLENFLPARSDSSPTLRPDWWYTEDQVYGISSVLTLPDTSTLRDALNSANGLYGSDQVTFFTTFVPYGNDNGTWRVLSGTHGEGTISGASGSADVTGNDSDFLETCYRGAILRVSVFDGVYTGGFYTWLASANGTNEYYLVSNAGADPSLKGDAVVKTTYYGATDITPALGTTGSLSEGEFDFDDNDTLGYNTIYTRNNLRSPNNDISTGTKLATIEIAKNVSGASHEWITSGAGTNEYYVRLRTGGGTDPGIEGTASTSVVASTYYVIDGSQSSANRYKQETLTAGTAGSLANYEYDVALDPGSSYLTFHIRDNGGDPDTRKHPGAVYNIQAYSTLDINAGSYKWTPSPASTGGTAYYLEASGGGTPSLERNTSLYIDAVAATSTGTSIPAANNTWAYGDFDTLGYSTIYVARTDGNPDATGIQIDAYYRHVFDGSPYEYTQVGATNEWYLQLSGAGGDPSLDEPYSVYNETLSQELPKGTVGSLSSGQWGWGQDPGASYNTIYVYDTSNPNARWNISNGASSAYATQYSAIYKYDVYCSNYKWTASSGGTNEYYCELAGAAGGDPSITEPNIVLINDSGATEGTIGSLNNGEWAYGDNTVADSLGYDTIYVRNNAADPDGVAGTGKAAYTTLPVSISTRVTEGDAYDYYVVDHVNSDISLSVYGEIDRAFSNAIPTFYYNHNPFNADYKLNIQAYTSGLIYCAPSIRDNLNEEDISGPFYADLQKGDWRYGGEIVADYNFVGTGVPFENQPTLASNGASYIQIFPNYQSGTQLSRDNLFLAISYGIGPNSWSKNWWYTDTNLGRTSTITLNGDGNEMKLQSIEAVGGVYVCAANVTTAGVSTYPGIAFSTDSYGLVWTLANDTSYGPWSALTKAATDYQSISAAWNGSSPGRIVVLHWRDSDNRVVVRYSDNSGGTWNNTNISGNTYFTGSEKSRVKYLNGQFIIVDDTQILYGDGTSFTANAVTGASALRDVAFDGDERWVAVENSFTTWYTDDITSTWTESALPLDFSSSGDETSHIRWDSIGERFVVNCQRCVFWSDDAESWASEYLGSFGETGLPKIPSNIVEDYSGLIFTLYDGGADYLRNAVLSRYNYYYWDIVDFVPLSDIYRSITFSVLDGYVVLLGTTEYDEDDGWVYYPRRIRWTAPATYSDFSGTGSGTADANGEGSFMDSRPVNGRIVAFETNRISAIVPRGDVEDPWDYDVVKEDFRILSNPVAVDDMCYVIATDGLLYATDGIEVSEVGSSFDATKFDDFTEDKPIQLEYSRAFNSLIAYYFDPSASSHYAYFISTSNGVVTKVEIPTLGSSGTLAYVPRFVSAVSDSSDQRVIASYHPLSTATDAVVSTTLATNKQITGVDKPEYLSTTNDSYWYATLETGELYLAPEGNKTSLKHIIVRTYTDAPGDNTDRPRIIAQIKSLEDDEWHTCGQVDVFSDFTLTDADCLITFAGSAAFTNLMTEGSGAGGGAVIINPPIDARLARIYTETGGTYTLLAEGTDYTTADGGTGKYAAEIASAPAAGTDIYAYWDNYPEIRISSGDFIQSTESLHRVTGTTATNEDGGLTLDHYLSSGADSETPSAHYPAAQLGDGESEVKIGVNKLVEGFKLRLLVVPHYGASAAPTIVKITGIVFGHVPQGRKILQATGS